MVTGILADVNIEGHANYLMSLVRSAPWVDLWAELELTYYTFDDVQLDREASDAEIWQYCQRHGLVLLTNNRNGEGPDSLEAAIRSRNTESSIPVLTVGDIERLRRSRDYAQSVAESLIDTLLRIGTLRGTGRLYLP